MLAGAKPVKHKIPFSVATGQLLHEIANRFSRGSNNVPGIVFGLNEIRIRLVPIATRAIQLQDRVMIDELLRLGIIRADGSVQAAVGPVGRKS